MNLQIRRIENCYWEVGRERRPAAPALAGDLSVDVAIIGGGYTGLASAYHLKTAEPSLTVAVLEAETTGFGASGRNGGFAMTLFGASAAQMTSQHGADNVRIAHHFMERSIDELEALVAKHAIDCGFHRSGFLRVATTPAYEKRIRHEFELFQSLGLKGIEWVDKAWLDGRVRSDTFMSGCWEPNCASLHPGKWLDGLRRIALEAEAQIFEHTKVTAIGRSGGRYRLSTPAGTVSAGKIVYATNGYTHLMPGMRMRQIPAFAYIIVTEPLKDWQLAEIGWQNREAIEDGRNYMHFWRLLPDRRVLVGGGPGFVPFGRGMDHDSSPKAWEHLERFLVDTHPCLAGVRTKYRWGGAFSMTADFTPHIGARDGGGAVYSIGCTGHGVAQTHMNGQIVRDLVLDRKTELTDLWFVNRWWIPFPPEPIRSLATRTAATAMAIDDWWCDRSGRG